MKPGYRMLRIVLRCLRWQVATFSNTCFGALQLPQLYINTDTTWASYTTSFFCSKILVPWSQIFLGKWWEAHGNPTGATGGLPPAAGASFVYWRRPALLAPVTGATDACTGASDQRQKRRPATVVGGRPPVAPVQIYLFRLIYNTHVLCIHDLNTSAVKKSPFTDHFSDGHVLM